MPQFEFILNSLQNNLYNQFPKFKNTQVKQLSIIAMKGMKIIEITKPNIP